MKHGYFVTGKDKDGSEFTFGKNETKRQVLKDYEFVMRSPHYTDAMKKTFKIVELVEKDITAELLSPVQ